MKRGPTVRSLLVTMGVLGSPLGIMTKVLEARHTVHVTHKSVVLSRVMDPSVGDGWVSKGKGSQQSGLPSARQGQGASEIIPLRLTAKGLTVHPSVDGLPRFDKTGLHLVHIKVNY